MILSTRHFPHSNGEPTSEDVGRPPVIAIGDKFVGQEQGVFIIAEAGVNHDGEVEKALRLVDIAGAAGADAVKFQIFQASELATPDAPAASYQTARANAGNQRDLLERLQLDREAFRAIRDRCDEIGIAFLATPFSLGDLRVAVELDVPAIKLASTDINNKPLVEAAAAAGKPLIASTGASESAEIDQTLCWISAVGRLADVILLHCVSCYPTPAHAANLRAIHTLRNRYGLWTGHSDHTASPATGALAVAAGAVVLEKHFTENRHAAGPDHAFSLEPHQLADYVWQARMAAAMMGGGRVGFSAIEEEVRRVARKSLVASRDVQQGESIAASMLSCARPAGGIAPDRIEDVIGRCATAFIPAGTAIRWELLA